MKQYIDKEKLVAEIKSRIFGIEVTQKSGLIKKRDAEVRVLHLKDILSFIDTLEVKEVDLEKELNYFIEQQKAFIKDDRVVEYYNGDSFNHIYDLEEIAKHFFELGLKAQKLE